MFSRRYGRGKQAFGETQAHPGLAACFGRHVVIDAVCSPHGMIFVSPEVR